MKLGTTGIEHAKETALCLQEMANCIDIQELPQVKIWVMRPE